MIPSPARASVEVPVGPGIAFTAFTAEIEQWWVPGPINFWNAARCTGRRIESGVGGRVLELYGDDDPLVLGVITAWEPGARLAYTSEVDETEVEVRFVPGATGTTVTVEQRYRPGADTTKPAAFFWRNVLRWYDTWCDERDAAQGRARRVAPLAVALTYADPGSAARWLHRVFGLGSWDGIPPEGTTRPWVELHVGDVAVILFPAPAEEGADPTPPARHRTWVYVDDLEAHLEHARAEGATVVLPVQDHGYRFYVAADPDGHEWTFVQAGPWVAAPLPGAS